MNGEPMPRFAILDPLTLVGQELVAETKQRFPEADISLFHTTDDEEHRISEINIGIIYF